MADHSVKEYISPIQSIFILDISGVPLFARYFNTIVKKDDSVLLAGFLSAIEIFTTNSLEGQITDLGLGDRRYFFERSNLGYMIVAATQSADLLYIDPLQAKIMKYFLKNIARSYDLIKIFSKENNIEIGEMSAEYGDAVDSLILEATLEFAELNLEGTESYIPENFAKGTELNSNEFNSLIYLIDLKTKKFFDDRKN